MGRKVAFAVAILGVTVLAVLRVLVVPAVPFFYARQFKVVLPEYQKPPERLVHAEQGWTEDQRIRFHHTAQGTRLLPYAWFMALEQPCFWPLGCELFSDEKYLEQFGFLVSQTESTLNPDGLPVGLAREQAFRDPETQQTYPAVGLTCAACHTGELRYRHDALRIDGAPNMIELGKFQDALARAVGLTKWMPFRYGRFEKRVLGPNASEDQREALKREFRALLDRGSFERKHTKKRRTYDNKAGFGRTDALTRIGNQVFAVDMKNPDNFAPANGAVRIPQIWDAPWLTWVEYNSAMSDPLVRNVGEALGVRAAAKLHGPDAKEFANSVNIEGLKSLEDLLAGRAPFQGLRSPKWPSMFPRLDAAKVARGAKLYRQYCQGCHLPPVEELLIDLESPRPTYWSENRFGKRFLIVKEEAVDSIGTDPHQALDFRNRTVDTGGLGKGRLPVADALALVINGIIDKFFLERGFTREQQLEWRGYRDPCQPTIRRDPVYKARPLNGIWAASPYLHNGSIPNLYELLSPQNERSNTFWVGTKEFDPIKVGYVPSKLKGGYLYDVTRTGNSNSGHEFTDRITGKGVIGPELSPEDRWALIEYMKSL